MDSSFTLTGKVALVTGASRGLGQALAIALAMAGAHVICSSSRAGGSAETRARIEAFGGSADEISADLSDPQAIANLATNAWQRFNRLDVLVNNGGTIARYPAVDFPLDEWNRVIQVNLTATFQLSQLLGKKMIAQGHGKIVNIASMLSYSGGITVPAYTASKHGVAGVTKALANEWGQFNIQVNAIAPGYFRTDNTSALQADKTRSSAIEGRIPAGRWGNPEDLGGAAVFLASAASNDVNGSFINVDGGWMAR